MKRVPLQMVTGNLVAATSLNDLWAGFAIRGVSYRAEPRRRQAQMADSLAAYARAAEADFQILRVSQRWDADVYADRLWDESSGGMHDPLWREYLLAQRARLQSLNAATPRTFLFVRLADPSRDLQAKASKALESLAPPREVWAQMRERFAIRHSGTLDLDGIAARAAVAESRAKAFLDVRRATRDELQWLVRRSFCRGLGEPEIAPEEPSDTPWETAQRSMVAWLSEEGIERFPKHLVSHSERGDSFQAGLCLGELGHAKPFSRACELMFTPLEENPFPVDAALNVSWLSNDQAKRKAAHQVGRTHHQLADEAKGEVGAKGEAYRIAELAHELHDVLADSGEPLLMGTLSMMVAGESLKELQDRVAALKRSYPWSLHRPYGSQLDAWQQHLPGQRALIRGYVRPFTCEQVGAFVPHASHEAGSRTARALQVAVTKQGLPILFDLREASLSNRPPTVEMIGTLGGGKTMWLQYLLWIAFIQGALIVDIDPKGDHRFHELPEVVPYAQTIVLGPDREHAGKLDPLRVAPENERHDAAVSFLSEILPETRAAWAAAISGAVTRVIARWGERACCWAVLSELMRSRGEGPEVGRMLREFAKGGVVQLGFGRLSDPPPSMGQKQVTYLQIRALKRAKAGTPRSEMTTMQRHGRAVLQLATLFSMRLLAGDRKRLKVAAFDEASFLGEDAAGQQLFDTLVRWARSEYAVALLSSQLGADTAAQRNMIGHSFRFAMEEEAEAQRALRAEGLDADGFLCQALLKYRNGQCLYSDLHRRHEEIRIDLPPELLKRLSTTPEDEQYEKRTDPLDEDRLRRVA